MRWKLIRRRLSHSLPSVSVRHRAPWPLRWAFVALLFGFFGALGMWAFEAGTGAAGLDRRSSDDLRKLQSELDILREERDKAQSIVNTADSILKTEKATQEKLAEQVRALEAENLKLKGDLGFFERLLPSTGAGEDLAVRGLQVEMADAGQVRYQVLVMQPGRTRPEFHGKYEITVTGQLDGKAWTMAMPGGARTLHVKQHQRLEGMFPIPERAVVKTLQVRVLDAGGAQRATQTAKL